jgi:hypothetical protein
MRARAKLKNARFSTLEEEQRFSTRSSTRPVRLPSRPTIQRVVPNGSEHPVRLRTVPTIPNRPPRRRALGLLARNKDGCTVTMLSGRGVKVETIAELLMTGLAMKKSEFVSRGKRPIEITRIAITDAGRRTLERATSWHLAQDT